jgi:ABC-type Fe3+ transport system permease subunit
MAVQIWNLYGYGSFTQLFALAIVNLVIVFALVTLVNTRGRSLAR